MTILFGDFEDFAHLNLHLLAAADAHERGQIRIDRARISARTQGTLPCPGWCPRPHPEVTSRPRAPRRVGRPKTTPDVVPARGI
ncbi:hypothetical protein [Streptomyces sp. NPDC091416]|uniref:hypothetical protein n=1 Tax=Streptomyces sp. NPDC091416 TaxID=3366003 RepID=UPI003811F6B1